MVQSGGATAVTEAAGAGHTDTYTLVLDSKPTHNVVVTVTSDTPAHARVHVGSGAPAASAQLTFTPTDWSVARTVTVTAVDDSIDQTAHRTATLAHAAASGDANYQAIAIASVAVTVTDDDDDNNGGGLSGPIISDLALSPAPGNISLGTKTGFDVTSEDILDKDKPVIRLTVAILNSSTGHLGFVFTESVDSSAVCDQSKNIGFQFPYGDSGRFYLRGCEKGQVQVEVIVNIVGSPAPPVIKTFTFEVVD